MSGDLLYPDEYLYKNIDDIILDYIDSYIREFMNDTHINSILILPLNEKRIKVFKHLERKRESCFTELDERYIIRKILSSDKKHNTFSDQRPYYWIVELVDELDDGDKRPVGYFDDGYKSIDRDYHVVSYEDFANGDRGKYKLTRHYEIINYDKCDDIGCLICTIILFSPIIFLIIYGIHSCAVN